MAESLQFSIGADTKGFNDGISGMITGLAGLAAAFISLRAVVESFSEAIDMGGRLHDLSTRTGETAGNLAILERAFDNTSVGAEKVGPALNKMQVAIASASDSSSVAGKAFAALGITLSELSGKSGLEQMQMIGQALAQIENPAQRAQIAVQIFGKSGGDLIPILRNFSAEIDQAKSQLGSLPQIMDRSAAGFDSVGDSLNAIKQKTTELAVGFLSTLLPAVDKLLQALSVMDAAGFGQGLAEFLLGAFQSPLKVIDLWANSMRFAAQSMGNELISAFDYAGQFLTAMFGAAAVSVEELMKPFQLLLSVTSPLLAAAFDKAMSAVTDSADKVAARFAEAANNATYVRKDYLGAQDSAERIKELTEEIKEDGRQFAQSFEESHQTSKQMMDEINNFEPVTKTFPTIANDQTGAPFYPTIANDQTGLTVPAETTTRTNTINAAQLQAELNRQLGLIAGASSTQVIGQSAAARSALEDQKKLEQMIALGKGDTAEARTLQNSIQRHIDQAAGISLTSADQYAASSWAWQEYLKEGQTLGLDELQTLAENDIMRRKREEDQLTKAEQAEKAKADAAGAGGAAGKGAPPVSLSSIVNSIQSILQKIEPKIPTHVMA